MFPNEVLVALTDGERVRVLDHTGNVFLNCSRWLFEQCWKRGLFEDLNDEELPQLCGDELDKPGANAQVQRRP